MHVKKLINHAGGNKMRFTTRQITQSAIIAALYLVITIAFAPISYSMVQFRISESLMLLAAITPSAIPGLFIGCVIANLYGGFGFIDIAFGSVATLLAAMLTWYIARKTASVKRNIRVPLLPLPTVVINGIIVGGYLPFIIPEIRDLSDSFILVLGISVGSVMLGQLAVTYLLGIPLYLAIKRTGVFTSDEFL